MRKLIFTLFICGLAFAEVDYWNIKKPSANAETKAEEKQPGTQAKEPDPDELLQESVRWYEEKIKKEKPPVEYYYFVNPDKYADAMNKWLSWMQEKNNTLTRPVVAYARLGADMEKAISFLKERDCRLMFFYKDGCQYCQASEPEVALIENYLKVYRIDVLKDSLTAIKWNIYSTPTFILISPKDKKAYRIEGYMTAGELIKNFYNMVREDKR